MPTAWVDVDYVAFYLMYKPIYLSNGYYRSFLVEETLLFSKHTYLYAYGNSYQGNVE